MFVTAQLMSIAHIEHSVANQLQNDGCKNGKCRTFARKTVTVKTDNEQYYDQHTGSEYLLNLMYMSNIYIEHNVMFTIKHILHRP